MLEIYVNGEIIVILDIILVLYLEIYHICLIRLVLYLEINIVIVFLTHLDINMSEKDSIKIVWELSVLFELQLYILWIFLAKYFKKFFTMHVYKYKAYYNRFIVICIQCRFMQHVDSSVKYWLYTNTNCCSVAMNWPKK